MIILEGEYFILNTKSELRSHLRLTLCLAFTLLASLLLAACGETATPALTTAAATTSAAATAAMTTAAAATTGSSAATNPCPDAVPSAPAATNLPALISGSEMPNPFRVGLVPNQNPDKVKGQYQGFKDYMEKTLGIPVELFVANDYAGVVQAMVSDKIDMAYFGGLTYVQARQQAPIVPIVTEVDRYTGNSTYCSAIIVPSDSPVQKTSELKGKTFAFGDISSTSGSLFPRIILDRAGLNVTTLPGDLKDSKFTGAHDATALAVSNHSVDAGGLEERILLSLEAAGTVDKTKVRVIDRVTVPGYPWAVRSKLDKGFVDKVVAAFQGIKDPDLLKLLKATSYTRVQDSDYNYVRQQAEKFGLLATKK